MGLPHDGETQQTVTAGVDTIDASGVGSPPRPSFLHTFGWLGIPTVVAFLSSAIWTAMLAAIQIAPNQIANALMRTSDFDFGEFWFLPQPELVITVPATITLVAFALGYGYLSLVMLFPGTLVNAPHASHARKARWFSLHRCRIQSRVAAARKCTEGEEKRARPFKSAPWCRMNEGLRRWGRYLHKHKDVSAKQYHQFPDGPTNCFVVVNLDRAQRLPCPSSPSKRRR
jgi:hypothetical protein